MSLRATTKLAYRKPKEAGLLEASDILEFAELNAPFNAWGYWREFVQSSLARLECPKYTLPLFRVQDVKKYLLTDEV